jgi:hypothetical protein
MEILTGLKACSHFIVPFHSCRVLKVTGVLNITIKDYYELRKLQLQICFSIIFPYTSPIVSIIPIVEKLITLFAHLLGRS